MKLPQEAFMQLNREQIYDLYKQVYENLEQKEKFIEDYITSVHQKLSSLGSNESSSSSTTQVSKEEQMVRTFPIIETPTEAKNIILGSSIIGKLKTDKTIPTDTTFHAYRGSSTIEKLELMKKYPETKMKTVILQDGTNSFLKFERKPKDVFEQYKQLVKLCREKINSDKLYLMTVIPIKNTSANMAKNRMYDEFNDVIKTYYENDPDINLLGFNKLIKEIAAKTDNIGREIDLTDYENSEYKKLYHDNVYLNYRIVIPFLKNHLMRILIHTSVGLISKTRKTHPTYANT